MPTYVTTITELNHVGSGPQAVRVFSGEDARVNAFRWALLKEKKLRPVGKDRWPTSHIRVWKLWPDPDAHPSQGSELSPVNDYEVQKAVKDGLWEIGKGDG